MTPGARSEIRKFLEERRKTLLQEARRRIAGLRRDGAEREISECNGASVPASDPEDDVILGLAESARKELAEIDAARERMDEGTYGICIDCEEEISFPRLKAHPWAIRCVRCQERAEKSSGPKRSPVAVSVQSIFEEPEET